MSRKIDLDFDDSAPVKAKAPQQGRRVAIVSDSFQARLHEHLRVKLEERLWRESSVLLPKTDCPPDPMAFRSGMRVRWDRLMEARACGGVAVVSILGRRMNEPLDIAVTRLDIEMCAGPRRRGGIDWGFGGALSSMFEFDTVELRSTFEVADYVNLRLPRLLGELSKIELYTDMGVHQGDGVLQNYVSKQRDEDGDVRGASGQLSIMEPKLLEWR